MSRMPHVLLLTALCAVPSIAHGQLGSAPTVAPQRSPAPGEPNGSAASDENSEDAPAPIPGTELGEPADTIPLEGNDAAETDFQSQLAALKRELTTRLDAVERRLDEQAARIDALQKLNTAAAEAGGEGPTVEPPDGTADSDTADEPSSSSEMELVDRAEVTKLRAELDALRTELNDAQQELSLVKQGQRDLDARLGDMAAADGASGGLTVLRNMQADPEFRRELRQNTRYRLRIHNTTGVEQPLTVNGVQWLVRADEWSYVPVPLGPVTVHRSGYEPLEIAEENIDWQADDRGFFVDYDLDQHTTAKPAADVEAEAEWEGEGE